MGSIQFDAPQPEVCDVIVVGGGNAALAAALSAHESGAHVVLLEAASREERGGNSRFAGTAFRASHRGLAHVKTVLCEQALEDAERCSMSPYTDEDYRHDLQSTSHGRNDPVMSEIMIRDGWETIEWMKSKGVHWETTLRKYYNVDTQKGIIIELMNGAPVKAVGDGEGLIRDWYHAVEKANITVKYDCPAHELLASGDTVYGVRTRQADKYVDFHGQVILACGGFSANPAMRRQYLGEGWDLVPVRGTKHNTGTMLRRAIEAGARPVGHWGAAHASPQDIDAPLNGDITKTPVIPRYSYTYGISVNVEGRRFFDEGEDEFALTYAKIGKMIGDQPRAIAYQIFDQKTLYLLQTRYSSGTPIVADTIRELAIKLKINPTVLERTVREFNDACPDAEAGKFEPHHLDGLCTSPSLAIPKSNWALRLDQGPFVAYGVTCGITFTYGGIATDERARVLSNEGRPMPGLYCTGEIAGGVFYHNYAGGAGLTKGAVFGRIAGREAALRAKAVGGKKAACSSALQMRYRKSTGVQGV
ncbi:precorrin 3B synthase CobZ [Rhinocladiella mackenziei CBS 650.93]|uniref:Precorrin 3B synthase CobZ n=1 Tax=Rhinocladiella mackenziei CBS 650.93 TaxID=1442369 RepID=A0A0D2IY08_9EURO|nr:precorrin 3B synthase CobZ [Rhinocladiella mackenziei CBS 650.93]KIX01450.1 precorrin 3B synthase CobZ [Rhinocladiella mackenziei CBS 650.93]